MSCFLFFIFFFNDTATTEIYTLSLHDALPIFDHGADVILMSFSNPGFSNALQDAVNYAWSNGVVVVAATGNDGVSTPTYPAGDAKVVGVSATDQNDALAAFSNSGADTFIAAPGVGVSADTVGGDVITVT